MTPLESRPGTLVSFRVKIYRVTNSSYKFLSFCFSFGDIRRISPAYGLVIRLVIISRLAARRRVY